MRHLGLVISPSKTSQLMLDVKKDKEHEVGTHPFPKQGSKSMSQQWKTIRNLSS